MEALTTGEWIAIVITMIICAAGSWLEQREYNKGAKNEDIKH